MDEVSFYLLPDCDNNCHYYNGFIVVESNTKESPSTTISRLHQGKLQSRMWNII